MTVSCVDVYVAGRHEGEYWLTDSQIESLNRYLARIARGKLK